MVVARAEVAGNFCPETPSYPLPPPAMRKTRPAISHAVLLAGLAATVVLAGCSRAGSDAKTPPPAVPVVEKKAVELQAERQLADSLTLVAALALIQTTNALLPTTAVGGGTPAPVANAASAPQPTLTALPAPAEPVGEPAPAAVGEQSWPRLILPSEVAPAPTVASAPSPAEPQSDIVYATPPAPQNEPTPQLAAGTYWAGGYWNYNRAAATFVWSPGSVQPMPSQFTGGRATYVRPQWVRQGGGFVLVPGYWQTSASNGVVVAVTRNAPAAQATQFLPGANLSSGVMVGEALPLSTGSMVASGVRATAGTPPPAVKPVAPPPQVGSLPRAGNSPGGNPRGNGGG